MVTWVISEQNTKQMVTEASNSRPVHCWLQLVRECVLLLHKCLTG
jgi:hypothetical protein